MILGFADSNSLAKAETQVSLWKTRCAGAVSLVPDDKLIAELKEAMDAVASETWNAAIEAAAQEANNFEIGPPDEDFCKKRPEEADQIRQLYERTIRTASAIRTLRKDTP